MPEKYVKHFNKIQEKTERNEIQNDLLEHKKKYIEL